MISFTRKQTPCVVLDNGVAVGRIWRARWGFALELRGIFWVKEGEGRLADYRVSLNGGSAMYPAKTLHAARDKAHQVLRVVRGVPLDPQPRRNRR